jgi:uncharacterized protein (DUF2141 family)
MFEKFRPATLQSKRQSKFLTYQVTFFALSAISTACGSEKQGNNRGKDPTEVIQTKTDSGAKIPDNKNQLPAGLPNVPAAVPTNLESIRNKLTVTVDDLRNQTGIVCYTLFRGGDGFPDNASKAISAECFEIVARPLTFSLEGLAEGEYGMAIIHDENRDGVLNKNFLGIPKEGLGFSNRANIKLTPPGPPDFESVKFTVKGVNSSTSVKAIYVLDL